MEVGGIVHLGTDLGCGALPLSSNHALDLSLDARSVICGGARKERGAVSNSLVGCVACAIELLPLFPVDLGLLTLRQSNLRGEDCREIAYCRAMLGETRVWLE